MEEWLLIVSKYSILLIDAMALILIVLGSVEAFVGAIRGGFGNIPNQKAREIWLRYARWLVAGLTFQLAADVLESATTQDWQSLARLGAIAVIRTFLSYFLERDVEEVRERQRKSAESRP